MTTIHCPRCASSNIVVDVDHGPIQMLQRPDGTLAFVDGQLPETSDAANVLGNTCGECRHYWQD